MPFIDALKRTKVPEMQDYKNKLWRDITWNGVSISWQVYFGVPMSALCCIDQNFRSLLTNYGPVDYVCPPAEVQDVLFEEKGTETTRQAKIKHKLMCQQWYAEVAKRKRAISEIPTDVTTYEYISDDEEDHDGIRELQ